MFKLPVCLLGMGLLVAGALLRHPVDCWIGGVVLAFGIFILSPDFVTEDKPKWWRWW